MKNQVQLITYVDRLGGGDLDALRGLLADELQGLFGGVHLLPFFHPIDGADAGFDPIDHTQVDARLGDWAAIARLSEAVDVMADVIVNHMSSDSPQFLDWRARGDASPYAGLFLTFDAVFPQGARIIPNPYNKIPGFYVLSGAGPSQAAKAPSGGSDPREAGERGGIFFVPGFPVMAWPMMAWVLDTYCSAWFRRDAWQEKSVIIFGAMEATLTPVMERVEAAHPQVRVFSLPSVDHPEWGVHIDLGVKGPVAAVPAAYNDLRQWLAPMNLSYGPELVRNT